MSNADGTVAISGSIMPAKIFYTRIYTHDSSGVQSYDASLKLRTHWLAFWDEEGNVYHVDSTKVENPTSTYQSHQIGVQVDTFGRVSKTFDIAIEASNDNPPNFYRIFLGSPINKTLSFNIGKSINKAPNNSYSWYMSEGLGQVDGVKGFGLVEFISH